jgi:hypothetical protein
MMLKKNKKEKEKEKIKGLQTILIDVDNHILILDHSIFERFSRTLIRRAS